MRPFRINFMSGLCLGLFLLSLVPTFATQQISPVQVLKISAGPAGAESNGVFALSEERSVFSRSTDREVIVFFHWENVAGPHKLVAQWRSPDGGASSISAIDYNATDKRFGAYWRLPLSPAMPLGTWSIEATMNGRPAGRFTFEITDRTVHTAETKRPLTEAEIYDRLNRLFVVLRRTAADGRELDAAAGFMATPPTGRIYTVMPAIDSTDALRAIMPDGGTQEVTHLVAWNRRQQWAVLQGRPSAAESLTVGPYEKIKVGSRCFSMEGTAGGIRVLIVGTVSGQATAPLGQPVWLATFPSAFGMPGAPVLDEYGEILGIVGAGMPGDSRSVEDIVAARAGLKGAPVIPFATVSVQPVAASADLAALRATGDLMPSIVGGNQVASAGFSRGAVRRDDSSPELVEEFSVRDKVIGVLVMWVPAERLRGQAVLRVFDADNKIVAASEPRRVNFRKADYVRSAWELPILQTPGTYRVDVLIDTRTYWRGFLRVNP
jgi:hypothetical protein